jgi:hypothetical protein
MAWDLSTNLSTGRWISKGAGIMANLKKNVSKRLLTSTYVYILSHFAILPRALRRPDGLERRAQLQGDKGSEQTMNVSPRKGVVKGWGVEIAGVKRTSIISANYGASANIL